MNGLNRIVWINLTRFDFSTCTLEMEKKHIPSLLKYYGEREEEGKED